MNDRAMRFGNSSVKFGRAQMRRRRLQNRASDVRKFTISCRCGVPDAARLSQLLGVRTSEAAISMRDLVFVSESVILSAQAAVRGWFGVIHIRLYGLYALQKRENGF